MLKYLGTTLNRFFGGVVQQPMPWDVIDKLATLEETCEQQEQRQSPLAVEADESKPSIESGAERRR